MKICSRQGLFELRSVNQSARSEGIIGIFFRFSTILMYNVFSLESPHRGDSNKYTQYTIFNIKKNITLNYPKSAALGSSKGLKNEFETAVVNEQSVRAIEGLDDNIGFYLT